MLQTVHAKAKKWFLAFCAIITYSLAMDLFFVHNQIVSGGFAGLAMVICSLLPISIGAFLFILNIPCLILSFFLLSFWPVTVIVYPEIHLQLFKLLLCQRFFPQHFIYSFCRKRFHFFFQFTVHFSSWERPGLHNTPIL